MLNGTNGVLKYVLSVLLFPLFFQEAFISFAWGAGDQFWIMLGKRVFLLLPVLAIILGCWASIACVLTVIIRPNRKEFLTVLFITWWDLGKSIAYFWGGVFKFLFNFVAGIIGLLKIVLLGLWSVIQAREKAP